MKTSLNSVTHSKPKDIGWMCLNIDLASSISKKKKRMTEISHHDKLGRGTFSVHISFVQKLSEGARVIGNQPPRSSFKKEINPLVRGLLVIHCSPNRKLMKTTLKVGIFMDKKQSQDLFIIRGIPRLTPPIEELSRSKLLITLW